MAALFAGAHLQVLWLVELALHSAAMEKRVCLEGHGAPVPQIWIAMEAPERVSAGQRAARASGARGGGKTVDGGVLPARHAIEFCRRPGYQFARAHCGSAGSAGTRGAGHH